ncbi:outer membrane protein assembly factor BamB [Larsenimonas rhizosphaerae]|uniref:Outer membrane protein assembly factor BamB n=1 Tax=Larsenimonas rhizosphaerae TaxID=2944682 RepID=A0AA42CY16_9GAMM|nr:outer membrane protein assembly factor BamB [Larsenimonas rhizosphaerae]MCM2129894.1 outer membrane protein assembly factor BamB [Larsenimonas rhizosphaerae]MCX2524555.1 outer membrane protein assembly factor BamB [Larsenimonas rhizosphaerae]
MSLTRLIAPAALVALLAGCAGNPPENPPTPLKDISTSVSLNTVWAEGVGSLGRARYPISPALGGGMIYAGSAEGHLEAIDTASGEVRWETDLDYHISSGLTLDSGRLYFGTRDGHILSVDATNGDIAWKSNVASEVLAPPQLNSGLVVTQGIDGTLTALDRFSGEQKWLYTASQPALTLRGTGTPRTIEPVTFAGFSNGRLTAFDNRSGAPLWSQQIAVPRGRTDVDQLVDINGQPLLTKDGRLFVTSYNGRIVALNARNGQPIWQRDESSYTTPLLAGDYLFTINDKSDILALDAKSGQVIWQTDDLQGRKLSAPALIDGKLAVGDYKGYVHVLDARSGELIGRDNIGGDGISVGLLSDGQHLYALNNDGTLVAYTLKARQ